MNDDKSIMDKRDRTYQKISAYHAHMSGRISQATYGQLMALLEKQYLTWGEWRSACERYLTVEQQPCPKGRYKLLEEVARCADNLYQVETIQDDPEGAAEIVPEFNKAVEALREFDKRFGLSLHSQSGLEDFDLVTEE